MSARSAVAGLSLALVLAAGAVGCGDSAGGGSGSGSAVAEPEVSSTTSPVITQRATTVPVTASPVTTALATTVPETTVPVPTVMPLFDFMTGSGEGWNVVNDTVMGGVSSGQLALEDGTLVFTGELSLENNGGFASVRSPLIDARAAAEWATRAGPRIVAEGDGRTWTVEVRADGVEGGWVASLATSPGSVTDLTIPWSSFEPVTRFLDPREADEPLDPSRVASIAFYLVDGVEGPFRLGLRSIS